MSNVPTLTDGVVTLRGPAEDDIEACWETCQDPLMQRWTSIPVPYSRDDAKTFLRRIIPGGWETDREWHFVVEASDDTGVGRFCGTISLRNRGEGRAEVSFGSHPWARGRGIIERALRLLLAWGFEERGLRTVIWLARRGNWASRRLAWRLGFSFDGTVRDWLPRGEELVDTWVGTLRRGEQLAPRTPWPDVPRLVGEQTVLRAPVPADVPRVVEAFNDVEVQTWLQAVRENAPHSEATALRRHLQLLEDAAVGGNVTWSVADTRTDALLASVGIFKIHPGGEGDLGYWTHPDARGRGVTTEACRLAVRHAFIDAEDGGLGLRRLTAYAAAGNAASHRVLERSGFTRVGLERLSTRMPDGSYVDTVAWDQLAEDHDRTGW